MHPVTMVRAAFPAKRTSAAEARRFVRGALRGWGVGEAVDDAVLLTSELVTNAVLHADTPVEVRCHLDGAAVQVEVMDARPTCPVPEPDQSTLGDGVRTSGRGLLMPLELTSAWGVTYRATTKTVWFRLDLGRSPARTGQTGQVQQVQQIRQVRESSSVSIDDGTPFAQMRPADLERVHRGWLSFLAEASDLLAGSLDEGMVTALAAQLFVPRLGSWCAFYVPEEGGDLRLTHFWHADETRADDMRILLEKVPPPVAATGVREWFGLAEFPEADLRAVRAGRSVSVPLTARGRGLGVVLVGFGADGPFPDDSLWLIEDLGRRIALGLDNARMYNRQLSASRALQRSLLPAAVPRIPGVEHSVVYQPFGEGYEVGGDFYDVFAVGQGRWRFTVGDVCGTGPESAAVTGLARHALRLLAGEGHGVAEALAQLNRAILDEGPRGRLITVLHGELAPRFGGGARLALVSAGHPLPLRLSPSGEVTPVAAPQVLLGAVADTGFVEETVDLISGDVLLCVTDGVTERRRGNRLLDDDDGLAALLGNCTGLTAGAVANRLREAVASYAPEPPDDDFAMLVLRML